MLKNTDFGTKFLSDNKIEFNFWAPDSKTVSLWTKNPTAHLSIEIPMEKKKDGWFQLVTEHVKTGAIYKFRVQNKTQLNCDNGLLVPDPASRFQLEDVHGPSVVINPDEYDWEDDKNFKGLPWQETIIYEIHTGTFTEKGTFKGIEEKLDYIASLGITAIELMPVADFPGRRNWGYDGVLPFAPDNTYGTPNDLKDLIKAAHKKGIMVFLDVVYNHFGPEGNYLHVYARSKFFDSKEKTPWGDAINFENKHVRNFFIQNAIYWLEEYHFDGLRFDAVHTIKDRSQIYILDEIVQKIRQKFNDRHVHLILENDNNEARFLNLYTAQWNDDFHHAAHVLLTGEKGGYYQDYSNEKTPHRAEYYLAKTLAEGFAYQGQNSAYRKGLPRGETSKDLQPERFINFLQNHDQAGNRLFAERISMLASPQAIKAAACIYLMSPSIPMLFMGEEFLSKEPFHFFCDYEENLAESVKNGRAAELQSALEKHKCAGNTITAIPDATSEQVFLESKLDWKKANQNKEFLEFYRKMLAIRQKQIVPFIPKIMQDYTHFEIINNHLIYVRWRGKNNQILELIANLNDEETFCDKTFSGELIAESLENSFSLLKEKKIIKNWGVYWFLYENGEKTAI